MDTGCENLTELVIPDSVTEIGSYAYSGCENLTEIVIPDSVTEIGCGAFDGCGALRVIRMRPDDTKFFRDYGAVKNLSDEIQKVWKMHRTGDFSGMARHTVKYPVLAADYLHTHDERLAAYIKLHLTEMLVLCIPAGDTCLIAALTQSDAFFTEKNIDKFIEAAQKSGQNEIFMLLMRYKNTHIGFADKPMKL